MNLTPSRPDQTAVGLTASFARVLPEHLAQAGHRTDAVWQALGLAPDAPDTSQRVPAHRMEDALSTAIALTGDPLVGLHAAQAVRPAHLGPLGWALMSCQEGESGLQLYERFQGLLNNELLCHHEVSEDLVEVRHVAASGALPRGTLYWWFLLAARLAFARWVSSRDLQPVRLDLPCPPLPQADAFQRFVGGMVRYDTPEAREVMPAAWLAWLNPNADPSLHALMQERTARQLAELSQGSPLLLRCRQVVAQALPDATPITLEAVAGSLRAVGTAHATLTPAQLQKHLAQRGLSFKDLVEDVRRTLALDALRHTAQPLKVIADRTGYAEPSSFHRAVKRWTGLTPAEVRSQAHANAPAHPRTQGQEGSAPQEADR